MLPVATGNIPDLIVRGPESYQDLLVRFRTTLFEVRIITRIFGNIPDLPGNIPDLAGNIPDLAGSFPDLAGSFPDLKFSSW